MGKRISCSSLTNIAIVLTLSVVAAFLGVGSGIGPEGLNLQALAVFCLFWGMGGAFISLQMSRWIAKRATGVQLVDGRTGNSQARLALRNDCAADAPGQSADAGSRHLRVA